MRRRLKRSSTHLTAADCSTRSTPLEFADGLRQACGAVEELESLAPADDWDGEEDAGE